MKLQALTKALISQGTVGTATPEGALDSSALSQVDEVLRFKVQDIQDQAADPEQTLLESFFVVSAYEESSEQPELNSFSIEQIRKYYKVYSAWKEQGAGSWPIQNWVDANIDAADAKLFAQVNQFTGFVPVMGDCSDKYYLSESMSDRIISLIREYNEETDGLLLSWALAEIERSYFLPHPAMIYDAVDLYEHDENFRDQFVFWGRCRGYFLKRLVQSYDPVAWIQEEWRNDFSKPPLFLENTSKFGGQCWLEQDLFKLDFLASLQNPKESSMWLDNYHALRISQPELSHGLILEHYGAKLASDYNFNAILSAIRTNLSADDLPELTSLLSLILNESDIDAEYAILDIIGSILDNPWSQKRAELLGKVLCYNSAPESEDSSDRHWHFDLQLLQNMDDAELLSFGLIPQKVKEGQIEYLLLNFTKTLSWEDCHKMVGSTDDKDTIERWFALGADLNVEDAVITRQISFNSRALVAEILTRSQDLSAARLFFKLNRYVSAESMRLLMLFKTEERLELFNNVLSIYGQLDSLWLLEKDSEITDFKQIDYAWGMALLRCFINRGELRSSSDLRTAGALLDTDSGSEFEAMLENYSEYFEEGTDEDDFDDTDEWQLAQDLKFLYNFVQARYDIVDILQYPD